MRSHLAAIVVLCTLLSMFCGCSIDTHIDDKRFTCAVQEDCGPGYVCVPVEGTLYNACVAEGDATTSGDVEMDSIDAFDDATRDATQSSDAQSSDVAADLEIDNDGSVEDADLTADVLQCEVDTADCDSNPTNGCETDLRNDSAHCGACNTACGDGEQCLEGACTSECGAGLLFCVGACVDPMSDSTYCGSTDCLDGEACSGGALCNGAGVCEIGCMETASNCDGVCVDLQSNASNCGTCGSSCGAGEVCDAGVCACGANLERCGSACVDLTSNPSHCGACDALCANTCADGVCNTACGAGELFCTNRCVDPSTSRKFCGAVDCSNGSICHGTDVCTNGACTTL